MSDRTCQLGFLCEKAGVGAVAARSRELAVSGVVCDSRSVRPGFLFVAVPGTHHVGARYVTDAVRRGAVAVVAWHAVHGVEVPVIQVADVRSALGALASVMYGEPSQTLQTFGITGTNGKTTTAFMASHILQCVGRRPGMLGTVEYRIGERAIPAVRTTPDAATLQQLLAQMVAANCCSAVMEVSSHALEQRRVAGTSFAVGAFTNLTQDHLDYHGDMEHYYAAKARLFSEGLARQAVVCVDGVWGQRLAGELPAGMEVVRCGTSSVTADLRAVEAAYIGGSWQVEVRAPWGEGRCLVPMPGRYNVANALVAVAGCVMLGVAFEAALDALGSFAGVPGRMARVPNARGLDVLVDYAHTDDALGNVLRALRETATGKIIVVFGCGGDRDVGKRPLMGRVASELADVVVVTSDNPRSEEPGRIIDQICTGVVAGVDLIREEDRRAAIACAFERAHPGDTVLIAGKGHECYQEFADHTVAFDDADIARELLDGSF